MVSAIWVLVVLAGADEHIPNINPNLLYHQTERKCEAVIKVLERGLGDTLNNMPMAFYCKHARATYDDKGNVIQIQWLQEK